MRIVNKYNVWLRLKPISFNTPERVLNFKRPKWLWLKKKIKKISQVPFFLDHSREHLFFFKWDRLRFNFKNSLLLKLKYRLRNNFSSIKFKNVAQKKESFILNLVKQSFRVDLFLKSLNFFQTVNEARKVLLERSIILNTKVITSNRIFLREGDILQLPCNLNVINIKKNKQEFLFSFAEFDVYTNSIVITKDLSKATIRDFTLLIKETYNIDVLSGFALR